MFKAGCARMQPVISQSRRIASLTLLTSVNPSLPRHVSRPLDVETEAVIERYYILAPQPGPRFFRVRKRLEEKPGCCRENKRGSSASRSQFAFFVDGLGPVSLFFSASHTQKVQARKRQENEMGKREFVGWGGGGGRKKVGRKRKNGRKTRVENWGKWGRGGCYRDEARHGGGGPLIFARCISRTFRGRSMRL